MKNVRVYIHIPFCKKKCEYCNFNSFDNKNYLIDSYFTALGNEINLWYKKIKDRKITSIFFGGGTPSYVDTGYIRRTLNKFNIDEDCEVAIEINPGVINREKLMEYKDMGINRISFGVQSLNDKELALMGRLHNSKTAKENILLAKDVGFTNISADLIFGYPTQTFESYKKSLKEIVELDIQHLSCYSLKVEEGTNLFSMIKNKVLRPLSDELDRAMYHYTIDYLKKNNIEQYEISNFAKKGYESKHNVGYWVLDEYIGLGISAHSLFENKRFAKIDNISEYIKEINSLNIPICEVEEITKEASAKEFIFLGLRLTKGIDVSMDFMKKYKKELIELLKNEYIIINDKNIRLTRKGMDFSNSVFVKFI